MGAAEYTTVVEQPTGLESARSEETNADPMPETKRPWQSYFWDTWDKSPEERKLIRKIDCTLVVFGLLGTFSKFIDRANLQTAFVSGMKEEMSLYGNELNYANTAYNVGMIVALWPSSLLLVRMHPKYFIPGIQLGWTICTFGQAWMKTPTQMYALRALTGIFSTGHYSGIMYLGGSWYQKSELAKRLALMNTSSQIGPMVNSYLQSAAYVTLTGVNGLAGWRWLMLLDGIISVAILIPQFFLMPDVPPKLKPNFMFSEAECQLARARMPQEGEGEEADRNKITLTKVANTFTIPEVWILWVISVCNMVGMQPSLSLNFWFKAWNTIKPGSFTVPEINNYTTPLYAIIMTTTLSLAWISDNFLRGRRWPPMVFGCTLNAIIVLILAATPVFPENKAGRWFLYYNSGWGASANCMFWAWTNEILAGDPVVRSFALAGLNVWGSVAVATIPLGVFKTVDQPAVVSGNYTSAAFLILQAVLAIVLAYRVHTKVQRKRRGREEQSDSSSTGGLDTNTVDAAFREKAITP